MSCGIAYGALPIQGQEKGRRKCLETNSRCFKFNFNTESTFFRVDAHTVRERCSLLTNRHAEKEKGELKQSGISPEDTPLDNAIKNLINRIVECEEEQDNQDNENIQKNKKERKAAEDMRLTAMENLAESKSQKRASLINDNESPKNSKKRRSSGSDTL